MSIYLTHTLAGNEFLSTASDQNSALLALYHKLNNAWSVMLTLHQLCTCSPPLHMLHVTCGTTGTTPGMQSLDKSIASCREYSYEPDTSTGIITNIMECTLLFKAYTHKRLSFTLFFSVADGNLPGTNVTELDSTPLSK